ncbi:MAG: hypothetical protein HPAVJP_4950 [Candidatus Hepatoplasma vulgare]|nr:MAG: hypothetical protein HPAVJP_4950 [Candidatus Hepatoplasma sp.]
MKNINENKEKNKLFENFYKKNFNEFLNNINYLKTFYKEIKKYKLTKKHDILNFINQKEFNKTEIKNNNFKLLILKNKEEFFDLFLFTIIVKLGEINPIRLLIYFEQFPNYLNEKNILNNKINEKLVLLDSQIENLNEKTSSIMYEYIFSYEKYLTKLIRKKCINENLNILELNIKKKWFVNKRLENIEKKINPILSPELKNLEILNFLSFNEKDEILNFLWNEKYINIDDLVKENFINKEQVSYLRKKGKNDQNIFDHFKQCLVKVKDYRNKISHLENFILLKKDINELISFFKDQYYLLRNNFTIETLYKVKILFLKNNFINKEEILKEHYKNLLSFKIEF